MRNRLKLLFEATVYSRRVADVQEGVPTSDQLTNIFEYLGQDKIGSVIEGASSTTEALKKLKDNGSAFQRPLVVDWGNGRAGTSFHYQSIS